MNVFKNLNSGLYISYYVNIPILDPKLNFGLGKNNMSFDKIRAINVKIKSPPTSHLFTSQKCMIY